MCLSAVAVVAHGTCPQEGARAHMSPWAGAHAHAGASVADIRVSRVVHSGQAWAGRQQVAAEHSLWDLEDSAEGRQTLALGAGATFFRVRQQSVACSLVENE